MESGEEKYLEADLPFRPPTALILADSSHTSDSDLISDIDRVSDDEDSITEQGIDISSTYTRKKNLTRRENVPAMSYELQQAYKILKDIMTETRKGSNNVFMHSIEYSDVDSADYYEVIKKPMWLKKIQDNILTLKYTSITEFVSDMRLMLENCYRYYGPDHTVTKKGIKLEMMMEQKLALLPRDLRDKTSLETTSGKSFDELGGTRRKSSRLGPGETSMLLNHVRHEKALRDKELRRRQMEERKAEKEGKEKGIIEWEDQLLEEPLRSQMRAAWELPQVGHFLFLCQSPLNTPEVPQYELERILIMPRESILLSKIMTSLLSSPNYRSQLDKKPSMPYKVWTEKLSAKVQTWYKLYQTKDKKSQAVFDQIGVEPAFFAVLGPTNPLEEKHFHELTFNQRLWLVKSICDYILHNHRTIQDAINEQSITDQRDYVLGEDSKGNRYLHFPQFCGQDLRIYRQVKWIAPKLDLPETLKTQFRLKKQQRIKLKAARQKNNEALRERKKSTPAPPPVQYSRPSRLRQTIKPVIKVEEVKEPSEEEPDVSDESEESEEMDEEKQDVETNNNDVSAEGCSTDSGLAKFELIVDSVELLRQLVKQFEKAKVEWSQKWRSRKKKLKPCEVQLYESLNNLLTELDPWETKLQQATRRLRNKLHKEWQDYQAKLAHEIKKEEEDVEDIWASDNEEAANDQTVQVKAEDGSLADDDTSSKSTDTSTSSDEYVTVQKPSVAGRVYNNIRDIRKRKAEAIDELSSSSSEDEAAETSNIRLRSRGRTRHATNSTEPLRTALLPTKKKRPDDAKLPNGAAKGLLLSHCQQNTASQARELYAWETLRQILVSPQKKQTPPPQEGPVKNRVVNISSNAYQTTIRNLLTTSTQRSVLKPTNLKPTTVNHSCRPANVLGSRKADNQLEASDKTTAAINTTTMSTTLTTGLEDSSSKFKISVSSPVHVGKDPQTKFYNYLPPSVLEPLNVESDKPGENQMPIVTTSILQSETTTVSVLPSGVATTVPVSTTTRTSQSGVAARRQTNLSIGIPSPDILGSPSSKQLESPMPLKFVQTPSSASLPRTPKSQPGSAQPVLTPASNSGTPKFLANVVGPNAQFMHFQLGSRSPKKGGRQPSSAPITPSDVVSALPNSPQPSAGQEGTSQPPQQQQTVLLIPAMDQKGNTVYLKVVSSSIPPTVKGSNTITTPSGSQSQPAVSQVSATQPKIITGGIGSVIQSPIPVNTTDPLKRTIAVSLQDKKVPSETHVATSKLLQPETPPSSSKSAMIPTHYSGAVQNIGEQKVPSGVVVSPAPLFSLATSNLLSTSPNVATTSTPPALQVNTMTVGKVSNLTPQPILGTVLQLQNTDGIVPVPQPGCFTGSTTPAKGKNPVFVVSSQPPPLGPIGSGPKNLPTNPIRNSVAQMSRSLFPAGNTKLQFVLQPPPLAQIGSGAKTTSTSMSRPQVTSTIQPVVGNKTVAISSGLQPATASLTPPNNVPNSGVVLQVPVQLQNIKTGVGQVATIPVGNISMNIVSPSQPMKPTSTLTVQQPAKCGSSASSPQLGLAPNVQPTVMSKPHGKPEASSSIATPNIIQPSVQLAANVNLMPTARTVTVPQKLFVAETAASNKMKLASSIPVSVSQNACSGLPQNTTFAALSTGKTALLPSAATPLVAKNYSPALAVPTSSSVVQNLKTTATIASTGIKRTSVTNTKSVMSAPQVKTVATSVPASSSVAKQVASPNMTLLLTSPTGTSSRLVMIQNGQTQSLGLMTDSGQVIPVNVTSNQSGLQLSAPSSSGAAIITSPLVNRGNVSVANTNKTFTISNSSASGCGVGDGVKKNNLHITSLVNNLPNSGTSDIHGERTQVLSGVVPVVNQNTLFQVVTPNSQPVVVNTSANTKNTFAANAKKS